MSYQAFREKVNLRIYHSRHKAERILRWSSFFVSIVALATAIYAYGFEHPAGDRSVQLILIRSSLAFYVLCYLARIVYTFHVRKFIKDSWFEGLLMALVMVEGISAYLLGFPLIREISAGAGIGDMEPFYVLFIQVYLLIIVGIELNKTAFNTFLARASPARLLVVSYLAWVGMGALLLMLPEASASGNGLPFGETLFTSVSAVTLCGLSVIDVSSALSFKGQLIVLFLIQAGGINILAFATFFATFFSLGLGLSKQSLIEDFLSADSLFSSSGILKQVILLSLLVEGLGVAALYLLWDPGLAFTGNGHRLFFSIFHAVSAFNNAGFTLLPGGLTHALVADSFGVPFVFAVLIFLGALGYLALADIFGVKSVRTRMSLPWKRWVLNTRIAFYGALILAAGGGMVIYALERPYSFGDLSAGEAAFAAVFHAINRSAGFAGIDLAGSGQSLILALVFLMFIGGASGSVTGGVKTSTFAAILLSAYATIRGRKEINFLRHEISFDMLSRAFSIVLFVTALVLAGTFLLSLTDSDVPVLRLLFGQVSAVSLSGLAGDMTTSLSPWGKAVIVASMLAGRVGTLLLLFIFSTAHRDDRSRYPRAQLMIG